MSVSACFAAERIRSSCFARRDPASASLLARISFPRITASRLLKSWAMPPARIPRLSSFCASCSCVSRRRCSSSARRASVMSRIAPSTRSLPSTGERAPVTCTLSQRISAVPGDDASLDFPRLALEDPREIGRHAIGVFGMEEGTPSVLIDLVGAVAGDPRDRLRDPLQCQRAIRLHGDGVAHIRAQLGEIAPALFAHAQLLLDALAFRDLLLQIRDRCVELGGSLLYPDLEFLAGTAEVRVELHASGDVARVDDDPVRPARPVDAAAGLHPSPAAVPVTHPYGQERLPGRSALRPEPGQSALAVLGVNQIQARGSRSASSLGRPSHSS